MQYVLLYWWSVFLLQRGENQCFQTTTALSVSAFLSLYWLHPHLTGISRFWAKAVKQFACCLFQVEGSIQKYCSACHRSQVWKLKCLFRVKLFLIELTSRGVRFFFYHYLDSVTVILANLEVNVEVTVWAIGNTGL